MTEHGSPLTRHIYQDKVALPSLNLNWPITTSLMSYATALPTPQRLDVLEAEKLTSATLLMLL